MLIIAYYNLKYNNYMFYKIVIIVVTVKKLTVNQILHPPHINISKQFFCFLNLS